MTNNWSEIVLRNFSDASFTYNDHADLQRKFAFRLANECSKQIILPGIWADLGAGTGLLAEALEKLHTSQTVIRVDHSQKMLEHCHQKKRSEIGIFDPKTSGGPCADLPRSYGITFSSQNRN